MSGPPAMRRRILLAKRKPSRIEMTSSDEKTSSDAKTSRIEVTSSVEKTPDQIQLEMHGNICSTDSEFQIEVSNRFSALAEDESSDDSVECPYFTDEEFSDSMEMDFG